MIFAATNPVPRRLKGNEETRPLSANRNTIKALEQRGLISPGKGRAPLTILWRLKKITLGPVFRVLRKISGIRH
jgi:hypothetical protein